jgi:hypothetical protein
MFGMSVFSPHQDLVKYIGPVAFPVVIELIKVTAEQGFKILFPEKPVVMSPMNKPVSGPFSGRLIKLVENKT